MMGIYAQMWSLHEFGPLGGSYLARKTPSGGQMGSIEQVPILQSSGSFAE